MDPQKRKHLDMETGVQLPPISDRSESVSPSAGVQLPSLEDLGLHEADLSMTDEESKIEPITKSKDKVTQKRCRFTTPANDSARNSPSCAPTPSPPPESHMLDVQVSQKQKESHFDVKNLTCNDDSEWVTTPGLPPSQFRIILDTVPHDLLSKIVLDTLNHEDCRLFYALSLMEEDMMGWDFDPTRTLTENKNEWKALLDDFQVLLTHVEHWRDNRDECRMRGINMDGRFKWDQKYENMIKIKNMCIEAEKEALRTMDASQRKGRFRQEVVLGKFAQRNGKSVVLEEGMSLGVDDGRWKRKDEQKRAREEREAEIREWEEGSGGGGVSE